MEIRVEHALEPAEVSRRIAAACAEHDVRHEKDDAPCAGLLAKETPLGTAQARYELDGDELVVKVVQKPAFLPEGMIRRAVEEKLRAFLDAS